MTRSLLFLWLFSNFSVAFGQKVGTYYTLRPSWHFDNDPVGGFHMATDHLYLLLTKRTAISQVYTYDLLSLSKEGKLIDSINTFIADTPFTGYTNLHQYLYGANEEVLLYYQQLSPEDNTWYGSAIERYNSKLERTLNWRGPTLRYSTVHTGTDGTITAFGLHKYGDLSRTIRINPAGQQVLDSNSRAHRTTWALHRVDDSFYCFVSGRSIAHMDSLGIVQDIETTEIPNAGDTYFPRRVSLLTSDTALLVSYFFDPERLQDEGEGLAKIDLEGRVLWNWTPLNQYGTARDAAALPDGKIAVAISSEEDLRIVDRDGTILIRKSYEITNQKKGLIGFRKIAYDPRDSTLWVAFASNEEFSGDSIEYQGVGVLHLDMEGNVLEGGENIEVTSVFIPELRRPSRVSCYPNPAQSQLQLELPETDALHTYRITDLMGKVYRQGVLRKNNVVEIGGLQAGLFLIEVESEKGFFFSSFIKS